MEGAPDSPEAGSGVLKDLANALYGGIRPEVPGHGGEECANYLSPYALVGETLLSTVIMVVVGAISLRTLTLPEKFPRRDDFVFKRFLLTFTCLLFGIEIGYKLCSRSALYLLNPCHVITTIEVCGRGCGVRGLTRHTYPPPRSIFSLPSLGRCRSLFSGIC